MRTFTITDLTTGKDKGHIIVHEANFPYFETAFAVCACGRVGPECQSPGEALDDLLACEEDHLPPAHLEPPLPWPIGS